MSNFGNSSKLNLMVHIAGNNTGFLRAIRGSNQAVNAFKRTLAAGSKSAYKLANAGVGIKDIMTDMRRLGKIKSNTYFKNMYADMQKVKSSFRDVFRASREFYKYSTSNRYSVDYGLLGPQKGVPKRLRPIEGQQKFNMRRVVNDNPIIDTIQKPLRFTQTLGTRVKSLQQGFINAGHAAKNFTNGITARFPGVIAGLKGLALNIKDVAMGFVKWGAVMGSVAFGKVVKDSASLYINLQKNAARLNKLGLAGKEQINMFNKLSSVSKKYGTAMVDATGAAVQFYAAGIKDADLIKDKISMIADVSLFAGKSFEEMAIVMSKALSAGYLDLYDFWPLYYRGVLTLQDLIGKLGNNIQEVMMNITKKKLTSEIAEEIIKKKTAEMIKLAETNIGVAFQLLQNSYRKSQEAFGISFFKTITDSQDKQAKGVVNLARALPKMFSRMGAATGSLVKNLAPLGGVLKEILKVVWDITKSAVNLIKVIFQSNALAPILETLKMIGGVIIDIINMVANSAFFDGIKDALDGINYILAPILDCVKMILWGIQPLIPLIGQILKAISPILYLLGFLLKVLLVPIVAIITGIVRLITNILKWLGDICSRVSQIVSGFFVWLGKTIAMTKPWKTLVKWAKSFGNAVKSAYNWVAKMANKLYNLAASPFRRVTNFFRGRAIGTPGFYSKLKGYAEGGVVKVNERGGELISLPNGSTVIPHDYTYKLMNNKRPELSPEIMDNIINKAINKLINTLGPKMDDTNVGIGRMNNGAILAV